MTFLRLAMEERGVIIARMLMSISFSFFYSVYSSYSGRHEAGASINIFQWAYLDFQRGGITMRPSLQLSFGSDLQNGLF
jgi:hypothetical protein